MISLKDHNLSLKNVLNFIKCFVELDVQCKDDHVFKKQSKQQI